MTKEEYEQLLEIAREELNVGEIVMPAGDIKVIYNGKLTLYFKGEQREAPKTLLGVVDHFLSQGVT